VSQNPRAAPEGLTVEGVEAMELLEKLASAVFPPPLRDKEHLTWPEGGAGGDLSDGSAESRLRAAEQRFRVLVEQIPAVTFMAVLGEGKNEVYVSPHVEQMLGYTQEEWLEDPFLWYWRLHPDDRQMWNEEFSRGCATGGPFRAECRFQARDGHYVWVHGEARIAKDELGRPMFLQGVAFDISEAKRAQEIILTAAVERARVEEELELARRLQTSILPRELSVRNLDMAAAMVTASEVGGDYYDVLPAAGGCWLAIGDVTGHGMNAGLVMLMVQAATAAMTRANPNALPSYLVCLVNDVVHENVTRRLGRDDHVTYTLMRYYDDGRISFAGAHEEILVHRRRKNRVDRLATPGIWIGRRGDIAAHTRDQHLRLDPGDLLVLYTDGITEARNADLRQFDIHGLAEAVQELADRPVAEVCEGVLRRAHAWMGGAPQFDDMTLVVARYAP
jgi:PAS domain S-box-containing protein